MKTILAYGDSLTWGSDPETGARHPGEFRWPDALQAGLGGKAEVITDGLRGRTTAYDEHLADCDRNGARILPTTLYAHAPLDLVILMLGANDLKPHIAGTALAAMQGMRRCVSIVQNHVARAGVDHRPRNHCRRAAAAVRKLATPSLRPMFAGRVEHPQCWPRF
ncbi:MAG: arylesterase, partial [Phyllobacteriaceae bacterium]|nr:arylesterase [Phyllobacteriaceae bacterium]